MSLGSATGGASGAPEFSAPRGGLGKRQGSPRVGAPQLSANPRVMPGHLRWPTLLPPRSCSCAGITFAHDEDELRTNAAARNRDNRLCRSRWLPLVPGAASLHAAELPGQPAVRLLLGPSPYSTKEQAHTLDCGCVRANRNTRVPSRPGALQPHTMRSPDPSGTHCVWFVFGDRERAAVTGEFDSL